MEIYGQSTNILGKYPGNEDSIAFARRGVQTAKEVLQGIEDQPRTTGVDSERENDVSSSNIETYVQEAGIADGSEAAQTGGKLVDKFDQASAAELADRFRPEVAPEEAVQRAADLIFAAQQAQPADRPKFVRDIQDFLSPRGLYIVLLPSKKRASLALGGTSNTILWSRVPPGTKRTLGDHEFAIVMTNGKEVQPNAQIALKSHPSKGLGT